MKAIVIEEFGSPSVLKAVEIDKPQLGDDQVMVRVTAAGVNPVDAKIRSGKHISCKNLHLPAVLGKDMSGIVVAVGKNIQAFKPGDAVFGCVDKTYAEYTLISDEAIVLKPDQISFEEAAAVSLAALTAYQAIHEHLMVSAGECVLVQSAAGGVGHLAVQLAMLAGATVSGTASGGNIDFLRNFGVAEPINYKEQEFEKLVTPDAVLDSMGGEVLYRSIQCVKPGGRVVCLPSSTKDDPKALALAEEKGVKLTWFMMTPKKAMLQQIADLMAEEKLRVHVEKVFEFEDVIEAHKAIESQSTRGKIVLSITSKD